MSASITSTSASSDSTPDDPKKLLKQIYDDLEFYNANHAAEWHKEEPVYKVLQAQLNRLNSKEMKEGISTGSVKKLKELLATVRRDANLETSPTYSSERAHSIWGLLRDNTQSGKANLEMWVDKLEQEVKSYANTVRRWKPDSEKLEPDEYVEGIKRALSSIQGPDDRALKHTPNAYDELVDLQTRLEKLDTENLSSNLKAVKALEDIWAIVKGSGSNKFEEIHAKEDKEEILTAKFDKLKKAIQELFGAT